LASRTTRNTGKPRVQEAEVVVQEAHAAQAAAEQLDCSAGEEEEALSEGEQPEEDLF
jgi:hypothetical protein